MDSSGLVPPDWVAYAQTHDRPLHQVLALASAGPALPSSLPRLFWRMPSDGLTVFRGLRHARRLFLNAGVHRGFCDDIREFRRLRAKVRFHRSFKRLMSAWRSLHVVLAIVLLALIGMHVWVSVRVGFRWLWS